MFCQMTPGITGECGVSFTAIEQKLKVQFYDVLVHIKKQKLYSFTNKARDTVWQPTADCINAEKKSLYIKIV